MTPPDRSAPPARLMAAARGPWTEGDAAWFAAHPGRGWRVRDAFPRELDAMVMDGDGRQARDLERLRAAAADPACPLDTFRVLVLEVRPGLRQRVPLLGPRVAPESTVVQVADPATGAFVPHTPDEYLARLRAEVGDAPVEPRTLPRACPVCRVAFATGDAVALAHVGPNEPSTIAHPRCAPRLAGFARVVAASVYTSPEHAALPREQWPRAVRRAYERELARLARLASEDRS